MFKKVSVVLLLAVLLALPVVFAEVSITKTSLSYVNINQEINVTLKIEPSTVTETMDLFEFTPEGWIITGWQIYGFDKADIFYETRDMVYDGKERTLSHWNFNKKFASPITVNYQLTVQDAGTYEFLTAWTYQGGFGNLAAYINVLPIGAKPEFPTEKPAITFPGITLDVTKVAYAVVTAGFLFAALFLLLTARKKITEIRAGKIPVEDLRIFIRFGLQRGYTLDEMKETLKEGNIATDGFEDLAREVESHERIKKHRTARHVPKEVKHTKKMTKSYGRFIKGKLKSIMKKLNKE
jgi:hypothetical protein